MGKQMRIKTIAIFLMIFLVGLIFSNKSYASISMSSSSVSVKAGETSSVTMTANNSTGDVNVTSSNPDVATATATSAKIENERIYIQIQGVSAGTATITVSGTAKDTDTGANEGRYSRTITVNVTGEANNASANLTNLGITPNDFTGFSPNKTTYDVTVPESVQEVEVYATAASAGAKVSGTGKQTLAIGANALNVVVTGTDGATKTYTINVTRQGGNGEEAAATTGEVKNGLTSLSIENVELNPKFETGVYEYNAKYIGEGTSLKIEAVATDPNYTTEIVGNQDLKEGDNTITVLVADKEGKNIATYQITVNKSLVDEEAIRQQEEEAKKQEQQKKMLIIGGAVIALIIIIVIIIIVRNRRKRAYAEEFSALPFSGLNNDDEFENDDYDNYDNDYDDSHFLSKRKNKDIFENNSNEVKDNFIENNEDFKQENNQEQKDENTENDQLNNKNSSELDPEKAKREELKRKFLEGYNPSGTEQRDNNSDIVERDRRRKHKGKRFK